MIPKFINGKDYDKIITDKADQIADGILDQFGIAHGDYRNYYKRSMILDSKWEIDVASTKGVMLRTLNREKDFYDNPPPHSNTNG